MIIIFRYKVTKINKIASNVQAKIGNGKTKASIYNKNFDASDVRKSIISAVSIKVMEPVFESQTKTKLGSTEMGGGLPTVRTYINDFVKRYLDNYLHKNTETAEKLQKVKFTREWI